MKENKLLVVIRIRGEVNVRKPIETTLRNLKLYHKNHCTLIWADKAMLGMVRKVQDYVAFGEINESTLIDLLKKRGRIAGSRKLTEAYLKKQKTNFEKLAKQLLAGKKRLKDIPGVKQFFRLAPPRKGFRRKGIKHHYAAGGVLGYRGDKINELVERMI